MIEERELRSVATLVMGTSPKGATYNNDGVGMALLNGPTEFGPVHPDCTLFTTAPVRNGEAGDLLFCVRGSTTGRMNWADRPYALGRGIAAVRCESPLETRFARYCLEARLPSLLKRAGGGTFPNLRQTDIATFPIPWPASRRKIAAVLAAYDELIENNLRRIQILEAMAQAVYREWFVNFRFPGHEDVALVDSPLGPIPEGWEVGKYGGIAFEVKDGVDPSEVDPGTRYVGLEHIPQESFTLVEHGSAADVTSRKWQFERGDVLFGKLRPYFHKVAEAGFSGICSTDAIVIRASQGCQDVMLQTAFSKEFVANAVATSGGTDRPRAKWSDLADFDVVMPDADTNIAFSESVRPMVDLAANLARQNSNLRATRDLLLPKLVSGELDVSDLDIDTEWLAS